ncbi:MAG: hypothetical protein IJQ00_08655, partial [Kiritimatiellae bacterium]|nr:hypothetical protein [Kiritimatiellia bacterium]
MRTCVLVCASAFALCANAAESGWFGFSLDGYANGQALGPGVGGEWQAASVVATNVFDGVRNGIAISPDMEEEIAFAPVAPPNGRDVERIDVSLCPEELEPLGEYDFDGAAGFVPALLDNGDPGYFGYTSDGWIALSG